MDEWYNPAGIDKTQEDSIVRYDHGEGWISMAWDPVSEDAEHTDGMVADRIIELTGKKEGLLAAGFFNLHCPYVAPEST